MSTAHSFEKISALAQALMGGCLAYLLNRWEQQADLYGRGSTRQRQLRNTEANRSVVLLAERAAQFAFASRYGVWIASGGVGVFVHPDDLPGGILEHYVDDIAASVHKAQRAFVVGEHDGVVAFFELITRHEDVL